MFVRAHKIGVSWLTGACLLLSGCLYRDVVKDEADARARFPDYDAARPYVLRLQAERPGLSSEQAYCTLLPETVGCAEVLAELVTQKRWERLLSGQMPRASGEWRSRYSNANARGDIGEPSGPINWNAYGLGVHSDQFGRPVQLKPWP